MYDPNPDKNPVMRSPEAPMWTLFCAVIDNHGDMGVCWRLARQLVAEYGFAVTLWVDDLQAMSRFLGIGNSFCTDTRQEQGVSLRRWASPWGEALATDAAIAGSAVVIEAFACELPEQVIAAFGRAPCPPVWINLEYLSAESWVRECHGLQSLHTASEGRGERNTVSKTFFFPGFVAGTGGPLRERGLLGRHADWQSAPEVNRAQLLTDVGVTEVLHSIKQLWISVFTYESASLASWLGAMAEGQEPILCLVPEGRVLAGIDLWLGRDAPLTPGDAVRAGALTIIVIPFLSQDNYDRLLSLCDLNLVRGEDSFVRAQWAARPLVWHIYPQEEAVHMTKLHAFLELYCGGGMGHYAQRAGAEHPSPEGSPAQDMGTLRQFWEVWNLGEDCRELWHHLRPQLPGLRERARKWQHELAQLPDLAANLVKHYRQNQ